LLTVAVIHSITSGYRPSLALYLVCRRLVGREGHRGRSRPRGQIEQTTPVVTGLVNHGLPKRCNDAQCKNGWQANGAIVEWLAVQRKPMAARDEQALYTNNLEAEQGRRKS
jgi:hypothetical protein